MSTTTHFRTCPLCEATCGLEVTVTDGVVQRIRGDRDDVFSHGFICPKGSTLKQLHEDPDRLRTPQIRTAEGFRQATWDEAFAEIDRRLTAIIAEHGPDAVGIYLGNPNAHNLSGTFWLRPMIQAARTRNVFSASTVDQMPRHVSSGLMYGDPNAFVVPDLDRTSYLLMLGANPYESNGSLATAPDWPGRLEAIQQRGGKVVVIDPCRTKTAAAASEHLFIRPGSDALLLCALANVIVADGLVDLGDAGPHLNGLDEAIAAVAGFTPELVAGPTGIDAVTIERLAHELAGAETAAVYGRMGVHTVRDGTIASWATDLLNTITGNLDRAGGAMWGMGAHARVRPADGGGRGYRTGRWASRVSNLAEVNGELPVAALAEEIDTEGPGRIRAMITVGGNPVLSTPNSDRLDRALAGVEFMVSVDIYVNETTRHADVILPAPSALEKSHYDAAFYNQSLRRIANYSPAVFSSGQPSESDVLGRLALLLRGAGPNGDPRLVDDELVGHVLVESVANPESAVHGRVVEELFALVDGDSGSDRLVDALVRTGPFGDGFGADPEGLTLHKLKESPHGIDFGPLEPQLPRRLRTPSAKVELAPESIISAVADLLARTVATPAAASIATPVDQQSELVLIGRRHLRSNNSWMHNVRVLVKGKDRCTVLINPADASARNLVTGDIAVITSSVGEVEAPVEVTGDVMAGVVSFPHGWGHDKLGANMAVAGERPGANVNRLTPGDVLDPLSGNATLNGYPVVVRAR